MNLRRCRRRDRIRPEGRSQEPGSPDVKDLALTVSARDVQLIASAAGGQVGGYVAQRWAGGGRPRRHQRDRRRTVHPPASRAPGPPGTGCRRCLERIDRDVENRSVNQPDLAADCEVPDRPRSLGAIGVMAVTRSPPGPHPPRRTEAQLRAWRFPSVNVAEWHLTLNSENLTRGCGLFKTSFLEWCLVVAVDIAPL
jgi:hypothetical protein